MSTSMKHNNTGSKLSLWEKLRYGLGGYGYNSMYIWISSFLTIYYTDIVGVSAAAVSSLLLLVRIYDAANDPLIGAWADRTTGRFGKYKSWVIPGALILGLSIFLLFSANPSWPAAVKIVWMYGMYIIATTASTCTDVPYTSLIGRQTTDQYERTDLASYKSLFVSIGANIPTILATSLIVFFSVNGTKDAQGYSRTLLLFCFVGVAILLYTTSKIIIRVPDPPAQEKIPLRLQLQTITKNSPLCIAALAFFIMGCISYGRYAIMMYYFTYTCNNSGLMAFTGVIGLFTGIVGALMVPHLTKRMKNKSRTTALILLTAAVCYAISFFFDANMFVWWLLTAVTMLCTTAYSAAQYSILPDTIDYGEYVTGIRCDGLSTAVVSLALKIGGAVLPAILLAVLEAMGYVPNAEQPENIKIILNFFMTMLPALLMCVMCLLYRFCYKLTPELYAKIQAELTERRQKAAAQV